ncbi:MAG: TIGR04086 family membrane protein [Bacilli bacterium]|nr:TIGR04086 family membrane protein [Bacilli bacterium]MDD4407051.1 TIGR04086 family membrane protein [Bacilli bacterium]
MNQIIKYLKVMVIPVSFVFIFPLILGILNLLKIKTYNVTILIFMVIISLISGFLIGKKSEKKGYLNGLILGILFCLFLFIFSLLFKDSYNINTIIYYLIIIVSSSIGSMFGIQKKETD